MPASLTIQADAKEFGKRIAVSAATFRICSRSAVRTLPASNEPRHCTVTTSSTQGAIVYSGATAGRAATTIRAASKWRLMSAIAGSAITASPSQLGATTRTGCSPFMVLASRFVFIFASEFQGSQFQRFGGGALGRRPEPPEPEPRGTLNPEAGTPEPRTEPEHEPRSENLEV